MSQIAKIGFELETGTHFASLDDEGAVKAVKKLYQFQHDGSICLSDSGRAAQENYEAREYASIPFSTLAEAHAAVDTLFGNFKIIANKSMGMHVHVSFSDKEGYARCASWRFVKYYQDKLKNDKGPAGKLARWNNSFCKPYKSRAQFKKIAYSNLVRDTRSMGSDRYMAINYDAYYKNGHKTYEFRSWQMPDNAEDVKQVLTFVWETVNAFVQEKQPTRKVILKATVADEFLSVTVPVDAEFVQIYNKFRSVPQSSNTKIERDFEAY